MKLVPAEWRALIHAQQSFVMSRAKLPQKKSRLE
jgi:hypothetical protein